MNLVVYLARAGVGSRRSCDELIREGVVTVNGEVATFPRQKITSEDVVVVRGEQVTCASLRYFLVNKPRGVASTRSDPHRGSCDRRHGAGRPASFRSAVSTWTPPG